MKLELPCPFLFQTHLKSAVQLNDVTTFARLWALKRRRENAPTESDPLLSLSTVKQSICLIFIGAVIFETSFYYYYGGSKNCP